MGEERNTPRTLGVVTVTLSLFPQLLPSLLSPSRTWREGYLLSSPSAQISFVSPVCLPDSFPNMC